MRTAPTGGDTRGGGSGQASPAPLCKRTAASGSGATPPPPPGHVTFSFVGQLPALLRHTLCGVNSAEFGSERCLLTMMSIDYAAGSSSLHSDKIGVAFSWFQTTVPLWDQ